MRKQVGFAFRQYRYSALDPEAFRVVVDAGIKEEYLDNGWETLNASVTKVDGNDVFVAVIFVKYADAVLVMEPEKKK